MKLLSLLLIACLHIATAQAESLILKGAVIFVGPNVEPIDAGTLVIEDDIIVSVELKNTMGDQNTLDLTGKFLTAGFWNSHVHYLFESSDILEENKTRLEGLLSETFLQWGFVNTIDTGSNPGILFPIHNAIESGNLIGPKIYRMGGGFVPIGGSPFYIAPIKLPEFESAQQAAELTNIVLNTGVDGIKMFTGSWRDPGTVVLMEVAHAAAAVKVAHAKGKLVFAHPSDSDGARIAIESGVDVLAHTFPAEIKGPWDKTLPAKMKQSGTALVPTLKLFRYDLERLGLPAGLVNRLEQNAIDQLTAICQQGIPILFGTDVGYMDDADTTREFELMYKAGLGFDDILASLTTNPSKLLEVDDHQGILADGYQADLVVLGSDPRLDLKAFADVDMVFKGGKIVFKRSE